MTRILACGARRGENDSPHQPTIREGSSLTRRSNSSVDTHGIGKGANPGCSGGNSIPQRSLQPARASRSWAIAPYLGETTLLAAPIPLSCVTADCGSNKVRLTMSSCSAHLRVAMLPSVERNSCWRRSNSSKPRTAASPSSSLGGLRPLGLTRTRSTASQREQAHSST